MKTIKWILMGYFNLLLSKMKMINKQRRELYKKRYRICLKCQYLNKHEMCEICGCFVVAKTKVDEANCPKNLW